MLIFIPITRSQIIIYHHLCCAYMLGEVVFLDFVHSPREIHIISYNSYIIMNSSCVLDVEK